MPVNDLAGALSTSGSLCGSGTAALLFQKVVTSASDMGTRAHFPTHHTRRTRARRPLPQRSPRARSGLTLFELVVVLVIVAALAILVVAMVGQVAEDSRTQITQATLRQLQTLILNRYAPDMAGKASSTAAPLIRRGLPGPFPQQLIPANRVQAPQLAFLFINPDSTSTFDPLTNRGWRGPYLLQAAGRYPGLDPEGTANSRGFTDQYGIASSSPSSNDGDPAVLDGWGNAIVIQAITPTTAQLVSAGPDGDLHTSSDNLTLPLTLP